MSSNSSSRRLPQLLGYTILLGCATAALWLATAVVVPTAQSVTRMHGMQVPAFFAQAFLIQHVGYNSVVAPIAVVGGVFLVIALIGRGPAGLVTFCRRALAILSGLVACLSLYLLSCGGIIHKLVLSDQIAEVKYYKRTLNQFALLEAAEGNYAKFREAFAQVRDMKMVEVGSIAEYSDDEARERVSSLIGALPKATNAAMKRRILATLCLFRERIRKDSYEARDLPRLATEAGAEATKTHVETLEWIAANLNQDGWEPLPLFKLVR